MRLLSASLLLLAGCAPTIEKSVLTDPLAESTGETGIELDDTGTTDGTTDPEADEDADGFTAGEDCDDTDPDIHPGADEVCGDNLDNDCDDVVDEECAESLSATNAALLGERAGDRAGASVASAGDVNGDGQVDLIVGAREYSSGGQQLGRAYVVFGPIAPEARVLSDQPGITIEGTQLGGGTGKRVSGLGDLDGDGLGEIMVTSDVADSSDWENTGMLHIFDGATLSGGDSVITTDTAVGTVSGRSNYNWLGGSIARSPDLNGDGVLDVWVAGSGDRAGAAAGGAVFLLSGADLLDDRAEDALDTAIVEILGTEESAYIGASQASVGDLTGDGLSDYALGVYLSSANGDSSGKVTLFSGTAEGTVTTDDAWVTWTGAAGDRLGCAVSTAGDQNNDGYADLWIGADRVDVSNADAGAALLVYGGPELDRTTGSIDPVWDARLLGDRAGQGLGHTLDGTRDVDGDGRNDLVLGTPLAGLNVEGAVALVVGTVEGSADIADRASHTWTGVNPEDRAGWQAQMGGDLLGTGQETVVVSAWESDRAGQDAGEVYIIAL